MKTIINPLLQTRFAYGTLSTGVLSLFVFFGLFILSSCVQETPCTTKEYTKTIPSDILAKLIYKGHERLIFLDSNTGDTHSFDGQGYTTDYLIEYTQEDCSRKYTMERKSVVFKSATFAKPITASLNYYTYSGSIYLQISFNSSTYSVLPDALGPPGLIDSMYVLGKKYYDVEYFKNYAYPQPTDKHICYYNLNSGILLMVTKDQHSWALVRVE